MTEAEATEEALDVADRIKKKARTEIEILKGYCFQGLRTVPIFVSALTLCASRKTWFKRALGLTMTQSTTLLMKAKFSYCDQINFNESVFKPGTPE